MSERKVNLVKILKKQYNLNRDEDGNEIYYQWEILIAIKEACRQVLELAAENAETEKEMLPECGVLKSVGVVNKQSILDTINQIE